MHTKSSSYAGKRLATQLAKLGIEQQSILSVMERTPRHMFIDQAFAEQAYENTALPIGEGQTISQPWVVAKMTELLLSYSSAEHVLEIGTGSGYQCAVLAQLCGKVHSVERIKALQWKARRRLQQLDLHNVAMKHGDGWQGWAAKGPYDGIVVTAAAASLPTALLAQLKPDGCLIIPIGEEQQQLHVYIQKNGQLFQHIVSDVRFVPLIPGEIV